MHLWLGHQRQRTSDQSRHFWPRGRPPMLNQHGCYIRERGRALWHYPRGTGPNGRGVPSEGSQGPAKWLVWRGNRYVIYNKASLKYSWDFNMCSSNNCQGRGWEWHRDGHCRHLQGSRICTLDCRVVSILMLGRMRAFAAKPHWRALGNCAPHSRRTAQPPRVCRHP